ncbi:MAG: putative sulfate exporter family transporter [Steroidobacteraceae bacterium]
MNELITGNRPLVSHPAVRRGTILVHVRRLLPGLLVSAALAVLAMRLAAIDWLQSHGISALTAAIVVGIAIGNTLYPRIAATTGAGVTFSKITLLRAGVILYGLRLTLHDVGQVGIAGVLIDALVLTSTFAIAFVLGTRVFRLDRGTSILIGAGSAICGAAAVMATEPRAQQPRARASRRGSRIWRLCGFDDPRGGAGFCRRPFGQRGRG